MSKPRILDLFCGCGGMSLGFEAAGFEVALAIDTWADAIKTYNHNHASSVGEVMDIKALDDSRIEALLDRGPITGVIGGPPCQGFSTVGTRDVNDKRNHLYMEYFRVVEKIRPPFFVIENVQGMLTLANGAFRDDVVQRFSALGYNVQHALLNAKDGFLNIGSGSSSSAYWTVNSIFRTAQTFQKLPQEKPFQTFPRWMWNMKKPTSLTTPGHPTTITSDTSAAHPNASHNTSSPCIPSKRKPSSV